MTKESAAAAANRCGPQYTKGATCAADDECASARCAGGNCCDVATLADGCVDCNYRGLCDECAAGYTLCDHTSEGR